MIPGGLTWPGWTWYPLRSDMQAPPPGLAAFLPTVPEILFEPHFSHLSTEENTLENYEDQVNDVPCKWQCDEGIPGVGPL